MRGAHEMTSNLTSCPSSVTKCPLHHTKVLTWGGCEITFNSHLAPILHASTKMSPPPAKVTLCKHFSLSVTIPILCPPRVPPPRENNIFHLAWKNSQESHAAIPIPSIRYVLRATNYDISLQMKNCNDFCTWLPISDQDIIPRALSFLSAAITITSFYFTVHRFKIYYKSQKITEVSITSLVIL